jgi:multiple antibiotic resistance protein
MRQIALTAFATFFVTLAPLKVAPVFSALTQHFARVEQIRVAVRATVVAGAILFFFGLVGDDVLRVLGITLSGVRVGGGVLLLLLAIRLVSEPEPGGEPGGAAEPARDIAVFPLATPMIAGPAAITATLVMASGHKNDLHANVVMFAMMALVLALTLGCMLSATAVQRRVGESGMVVFGRLIGILLAALAADLILAGLKESGVFFR